MKICRAKIKFPGVIAAHTCGKPATHELTTGKHITPLCRHCYIVAARNGLYAKSIAIYTSKWVQKTKTGIEKYEKKPDILGKNES